MRPPREADRDRFVDLFGNEKFMVFYPGVPTEEEAWDRFDHMVAVRQAIPFGKQPVVELSSGLAVGYTGVDYIDFEGRTWLEWGYRLVPECRKLGFAFWKQAPVEGDLRNLYTLPVGEPAPEARSARPQGTTGGPWRHRRAGRQR